MTQARSPSSPSEREQEGGARRQRVAALVVAIACLLTVLVIPVSLGAASTTGVVAQENNSSLNETAPYYDNQTAVGNQTGWVPSDVSLESLGNLATRFGPFVIGPGTQIPGGTTYAGTLILGLVMVGVFMGSVMYTSVGAAGGAVVATVAGYGLVNAGLAPAWLRVVLVIILGAIVSIAALRATR